MILINNYYTFIILHNLFIKNNKSYHIPLLATYLDSAHQSESTFFVRKPLF